MWRCCGKWTAASGWEQNAVYGVMCNTESVSLGKDKRQRSVP
jgi:hypothetical protein